MVTVLQIMVLVFMIYLITVTISRFRRQKIKLVPFIFWTLIWLGVIVMSFVPKILGGLAEFTGTNPRDLVVHISIIVAFYFMFLLETKINEMNNQIKILEEYLRGEKK